MDENDTKPGEARNKDKSFKVVLPLAFNDQSAKYPQMFAELGAEFINKPCKTDDEFIEFAHDADAIVTLGNARPVPRKVIENLERCRIICTIQVGYEKIDIEAAAERGILVTNVPDYCIEEVSDHAMGLILACSRRIVMLDRAVRRSQWIPGGTEILREIRPKINRLYGQTLGLFGFGRLARTVANKAKGFNLRIIAYDPYVGSEVAQEMGVEIVGFEDLLKESDFISIHAALTPEGKRIFGQEAFKLMKPTACLINTARGEFVDEAALYQALKDGKLNLAALDVMETEPPDPNNPLLGMEEVIITAHNAFFSPHAAAESWSRPVGEIALVMRGEWPKSIVNPKAKEKYLARWGAK
ncbi:C-terminal binding protein [Chloroflexota bacterium]